MRFSFLRAIDQWIGGTLLHIFAWPLRLFGKFLPAPCEAKPRHVFLKLKGGGSLMIALPALLGLRQQYPQAEFILVCAREAKIYAELTGLFDCFILIEDSSFLALARSGLKALHACLRASLCVDLEPNSTLASAFTMLSYAVERIGFVAEKSSARAAAYSKVIAFDATAPIYPYYDQICTILGAVPATIQKCGQKILATLPPPTLPKFTQKTVGLAAFTSDFAQERMMPPAIWGALLKQAYDDEPLRLVIFGATHNKDKAENMRAILQKSFPSASILNEAGTGSLAQAASNMKTCDEIWSIDSGLLHIARILGIPTRSFWGPTQPQQRLRPMPELKEIVRYRPFSCAPCVPYANHPPCGGYNLCMISMAQDHPDLHTAWANTK